MTLLFPPGAVAQSAILPIMGMLYIGLSLWLFLSPDNVYPSVLIGFHYTSLFSTVIVVLQCSISTGHRIGRSIEAGLNSQGALPALIPSKLLLN
jgi:hypothetical protein